MKTVITIICMFSLFVLIVSDSSDNHNKPNAFQMGVRHKPVICQVTSRKGDLIHVHYTGTLEDGTEFDSSYSRKNPLTFRLGSSQVIKGWEKGLTNMCMGEVRRLIIGSNLAYGARGAPPKIPPHSTLYFEIELIHIERSRELRELQKDFIPGPPDPPKTEL